MLPVGTVTLLLADIESSTRLWEGDAEAMTSALADHDELVADSVGVHGGVRPVEQGEGDSFVAAFARASDAVACALDLQRRLGKRTLRVRIGIHTGEVQLRDEGNYVGQTIIRAARLRDAAHGGQVVLSRPTRDLVLDRLPEGAWLRELGSHHLKNLDRPEEVFQLGHPALADDFPPLRSLRAMPNNLPTQLTSFVGRRAEIDEIKALVAEHRVVTLTGSGGCGKTRLALQVGAEVIEDQPGGVWFVDLSATTDADRLWATIASALSLREQGNRPVADVVAADIGDASTVLILDNCEQVLEAAAAAVVDLVQRCGGLRVVATSREALGVAGESSYRVPSLTLPLGDNPPRIEALRQSEAVELFCARAQAARHTFALTEASAATVVRICSRLEGIPLAIELAAARVRALTPDQIADGLDDHFRLLAGGPRTVMARQQTLRASIDWSHDLLGDREAMVFRRLGVFVGGFTLEAAEAVCQGDEVEPYDVLDLVSHLVDRSLVLLDDSRERPRYRMLETVRSYALERLRDAAEETGVRDRHLGFYVRGLVTDAPRWRGSAVEQFLHLGGIEVEYPNLLIALGRAYDQEQLDAAARLAVVLTSFWANTRPREGRSWLKRLLARSDDLVPEQAAALYFSAGEVEWSVAMIRAIPYFQESLRIAREHQIPSLAAGAALQLGNATGMGVGTEEGRHLMEEAVTAAREARRPDFLVRALLGLGDITAYSGNVGAGLQLLSEAVDVAETTGNATAIMGARVQRANVGALPGNVRDAASTFDEQWPSVRRRRGQMGQANDLFYFISYTYVPHGKYGRARELLSELRRIVEPRGMADTFGRWVMRYSCATVEMADGDLAAAVRELEDLLKLAASWGRNGLAYALYGLCQSHCLDRDVQAAARRSEELTALVQSSGYRLFLSPALLAAAMVAESQNGLDRAEDLCHEVLTHERSMPSTRFIPDALERLAGLAAAQESDREAARLLGGAQATRDATGLVRFTNAQPAFDMLANDLRDRLGDDFDAAFAEGYTMSMDEVIAYASRGRGERKRPSSGWASLTPTEVSVVDLVAEGMTNRQIGERLFVSPRTVQSHLRSVFTKLGVATRAELAAQATRRNA